ncbi:hypothetical protein QWJ34_02945 [Saccharibacillus sp. CPCC 101409]|uniref:hypothetical protein n=1 Tax=Saccharibacillus sp. CPCC 101409 TaxID=3058041 RepID=UPI002673DB65|nr:hypothetical protein [Saccharibacillus sp. CPCC 101409]MDO3408716.1 hypothetical protein [Saccharibacillus sp. CPCC 101409]
MTSSTSNSSVGPEKEAGGSDSPDGFVNRADGSRQARSRRRGPLRRIGLGLLVFALLVTGLEIFVFRSAAFYAHAPGFVGQIGEVEATFDAEDEAKIHTIILGDSMSRDGLRPTLLAKASGEPADAFFNFSLSGGSAFDMAHMYASVEDRLPNLQTAIVAVQEHQFNNDDAGTDSKFRYYANLQERFQAMNAHNYGELLMGWTLKSYDLRGEWRKMVDKYGTGDLYDRVRVYKDEHGLPADPTYPPKGKTKRYAEATAERWFADYEPDGVRTKAFEQMLRKLHKRGVRIVMVQLPRSDYFEQAVGSGYAADEREFQDLMGRLAKRYEAEYARIPNDSLDFEREFRDTNHVNPEGAQWVGDYVARTYLN